MRIRAVANKIILRLLPRENKEGRIFLPETRARGTRTHGECVEARVMSVGPEVREEVVPGVILLLDPSALDDCTFEVDGVEYVSVPDLPYDWISSKGSYFGVTKHDWKTK